MLLKSQSTDEAPTINLTSMIDVLFLLIIFFMVGTRFNESEKRINLNLPKVNGAAAMIAGPTNRVVSIDREGRVRLDGRELGLGQLSDELKRLVAQYRDLQVDLRGDGGVVLQRFGEVTDVIKTSGVSQVNLVMATSQMPMRR
jgi:biopolymer transport protein ExbD